MAPRTSGTSIVRPGVGSRRAATRHAGSTGQWSMPSNSDRAGDCVSHVRIARRPPRSMRHSRSAPSSRSVGSPSRSLVSARSRTGAPSWRKSPSAVGNPSSGTVIVPASGGPPGRTTSASVCRPDPVEAGLQPPEAGERQPADLAPEAPIPFRAPGLDARDVRRIGDGHPAGRKMSIGAGLGPMRTYVARPPLIGFVVAVRPDEVVPSSATAIGPSPNLASAAAA